MYIIIYYMHSRFSQKQNKLTQHLITILSALNVISGFIFAFENKIQILYILSELRLK